MTQATPGYKSKTLATWVAIAGGSFGLHRFYLHGWGDRWGPATRIPTLIVSPFDRRGYIDKTAYDTTSILKLITRRFDLEKLPGVREKMGDLTAALDLQ